MHGSAPYHVESRLPTERSPGPQRGGEPFVDHDDRRSGGSHVGFPQRPAHGHRHADGLEVVVGDEADDRARGGTARDVGSFRDGAGSVMLPTSGMPLAAAANFTPFVPRNGARMRR